MHRSLSAVGAALICILPMPVAVAQNSDFWASQLNAPAAQRPLARRDRERAAIMKPTAAPLGPDAAAVAERTLHRKSNAFVADFGTIAKMVRTEPMASGEQLVSSDITAAHATLPIGSSVLVSDVATGRSLVVRVKDRTSSLKVAAELSAGALANLGIKEKDIDKARVRIVPVWVPTGEPLFWPRVTPRDSLAIEGGNRDGAAKDGPSKDPRTNEATTAARVVPHVVRE